MSRDVQLHKLNRKRKRERITELESEMHSLPIPPSLSFSPSFNPHLNLSALYCREFSGSSSTSHSRPACQRPLRAEREVEGEREREDVLMNPLTEQRVHLSGNPIKSQGEMLLCLPLIIASLPCTTATALFLEVYWVGGAGEMGGVGGWAGGGQRERGEGDLLTMHTVLARCTACATSVRLFCTSPSSSSPSLSLLPFLFLSLCPSLPPLHSPLSSFFNLLFIA